MHILRNIVIGKNSHNELSVAAADQNTWVLWLADGTKTIILDQSQLNITVLYTITNPQLRI